MTAPVPRSCEEDSCVTCSDTAVPVTIVRLLADGLAVADTGQGEEEISVALVRAGAGDTVLVHAKEAIAVVASQTPSGPGTEGGQVPRGEAGDAGR